MKFWIDKNGKGEKLVVVSDDILYTANPSLEKLENYAIELKQGTIPKALTGTPFKYMKIIEFNDVNDKVLMLYGKKNSQEIQIADDDIRKELLEYLRDDSVNFPSYKKAQLSWFGGIKRHLISLGIIGSFTTYSLIIAAQIDKGYEFIAQGLIGGVVLSAAELLGFNGVLILGGSITALILFIMIRRLKHLPTVETLDYVNKRTIQDHLVS